MDVRRFLTETKSEIVKFLRVHLNDEEFEDLWARSGGSVDVSVVRPNWKLEDALERPCVLLEKSSGSTDYATVSNSQFIAEGYWKELYFILNACTDDGCGGKITVDDLASAIELIFAKYASELQAKGIMVWELTDSAESDESAQYHNSAALRVRVLVPGATIQPQRIELGRFQFNAQGQGNFYPGIALIEAQSIEAELLSGTAGVTATAVISVRNASGVLKQLQLTIPRATAAFTRIYLTGGEPGELYKSVTGITVSGGQAGYLFAIYNKI